jgi:microcystin-dependent protein
MAYLGEIRLFAGTYAPANWMFCEGQLLPISEYTELFDAIGTTYGGDGESSFALPDLRGRAPVDQGSVSDQTFKLGQSGGTEAVALTVAQLPAHTHPFHAVDGPPTQTAPANAALARGPRVDVRPYGTDQPVVSLAPAAIGPSGGSQPHANVQPFVAINFIIAVSLMYPTDGPFISEIGIFPFDFMPRDWAPCNGQLLPIGENTALFSLIGSVFGGDGTTTFALPNLQGSTPIGTGEGPGRSPRVLGQKGGSATVALNVAEIPSHSHAMSASAADGSQPGPTGQLPAVTVQMGMYGPPTSLVPMNPHVVGSQGGGQPHNNLQPYLTLNFGISLRGLFPPRD